MKTAISKVLSVLLILVGVSYVVYNIYLKVSSNINTEYAVISDTYEIIETDCFVIRDEAKKSGNNNMVLIENSGEGVYIPYIEDGSRVAAGDTIALFFSSENDAIAYREKQAFEETLDYYYRLQTQSVMNFLDIDKLDKTINDEIVSFISKSENNNLSEVSEILSSLKYNISSKKIAMGEEVDFSDKINELKSKIESISSKSENYKKISAAFPGCYISNVDGYEEAYSYKDVTELTVRGTKELLEKEPDNVKSNVIGKTVGEYNWYAVCCVPYISVGDISIGDKLNVSFSNTKVSSLVMKVKSISAVEDGLVSIVLQSNEMNSSIAALRKEKIRITVKKYSGLKIPKEALRTIETVKENDDGEAKNVTVTGVFVLYGQVVKFRETEILYYDNDYVIAEYDEVNGDLSLYDMVITKGRNLYDGKIIY